MALPSSLANALLTVHRVAVYDPLNLALSSLANLPFFPPVTPNMVTALAGVCVAPCLYLLYKGDAESLALAGGITLAHDILDRLDGAVARSSRFKNSPGSHDGNFGAFLDAQVDKIFHIGMLSGLVASPASACLGGLWRMLAVTKIGIQSTLFFVRFQDYYAPAGSRRKVQAQGEGKLATFAANMAAAGALFTLSQNAKGNTDAVLYGRIVVTALLVIGTDMALRSLNNKLKARLPSPGE